MTLEEAKKHGNGLYRIYWKGDGGMSEAAVGRLHDGTPWFAPTNWTSKSQEGIASTSWRSVSHIELAD